VPLAIETSRLLFGVDREAGDPLSFAFSFADEHLGTDLAAEFKRDDTWSALIEESPAFVLAHGARSKRSSERKANIHPIAIIAASKPSLWTVAAASSAVIGRTSLNARDSGLAAAASLAVLTIARQVPAHLLSRKDVAHGSPNEPHKKRDN
jgi:hypothetical protein